MKEGHNVLEINLRIEQENLRDSSEMQGYDAFACPRDFDVLHSFVPDN
jgi:hypothetical protein